MMRRRRTTTVGGALALVAVLMLCASCAMSATRAATGVSSGAAARAPSPALIAGNAVFAGRILTLLAKTEPQVVLSPYSISEDLAMVDAGARGSTALQIGRALNFAVPHATLAQAFGQLQRSISQINRPGATLDVANAVYGQQRTPFHAGFLRTLASNFGAPLRAVDFSGDPQSALSAINGWVSQHTDGKIPSLLAPSDLDTAPPPKLVLINAIYLDARWAAPFAASDTYDAPFAAPAGTESVSTMHQDLSAGYATHPGYRVLALPYVGGRLALDILLPDAGALSGLESTLTRAGITGAVSGLHIRRVAVALPRFTLDVRSELQGALSTLGMPIAFSAAADFSGIGGGSLTISKVVHEADIDVDEAGTRAAAATGTILAPTAVEAPPALRFTVDRPFVFALRDRRTGAVLFTGLVSSP